MRTVDGLSHKDLGRPVKFTMAFCEVLPMDLMQVFRGLPSSTRTSYVPSDAVD
ncbi:MAG: hypothetical protein MZV63_57745 [Marinilabiliales bacterium]|nr:hypothetical protein [Marinilabiliales bacterium]